MISSKRALVSRGNALGHSWPERLVDPLSPRSQDPSRKKQVSWRHKIPQRTTGPGILIAHPNPAAGLVISCSPPSPSVLRNSDASHRIVTGPPHDSDDGPRMRVARNPLELSLLPRSLTASSPADNCDTASASPRGI